MKNDAETLLTCCSGGLGEHTVQLKRKLISQKNASAESEDSHSQTFKQGFIQVCALHIFGWMPQTLSEQYIYIF